MKNTWIHNHKKKQWRIIITATDISGSLVVIDEVYQPSLMVAFDVEVSVDLVEVVDGNGRIIYSVIPVGLNSLQPGVYFKIDFRFSMP